MKIKRFSILDYKNEEAAQYNFSDFANIIYSDTNRDGKSSILKSIYYALGYDIATFPINWNYFEMRFRLDITIKKKEYFIVRQNDIFFVNNFDKCMSKVEYTAWLEELLGVEMKLKYKTQKELHKVYASQYLLPYYIDQDTSWTGFLYKGSDKSSGAFGEVPKAIFDYIFSISSDEILELEAEKKEISSQKNILSNQIQLLISMENEFINNEGQGTLPDTIEKYKLEIENYLLEINRLNEILSNTKNKYIANQSKINQYRNSIREAKNILDLTDKEYKKIEYVCAQCNSVLTLEQSSKRLRLSNNKYELIERIKLLSDKTIKLLQEKENIGIEIQEHQNEYKHSMEKIMKNKQAKTIQEYIEMKKDELMSGEYQRIKNDIHNNIDGLSEKIKEINKKLNQLKRRNKGNTEKIISRYDAIKNDLQYKLKDEQLHNIEFYNFKQIQGSGISMNKTILALYLTYTKLIQEFSVVDIPFGMDSFIKNEIASEEEMKMFKAMIDHFINLEHQTFFSVLTSNKERFLDGFITKQCKLIKISKPLLSREKYFELKQLFE